MGMVIAGAALAGLAAIIYNAGVALQSLEARRTPTEHAWRAGLVARLVRRPLWLLGTVLGLVGWPIHTAALLLAPLSVVQPALALGLVALLAVGARALGESVTRADVAAVGAIVVGVLVLALVAPAPPLHARAGRDISIVLVGLGAVIGALWAAVRRRPNVRVSAPVLAGLCFGWSGLSTQLVADAVHHGDVVAILAWTAATGAASGLGLVAEMTALQRSPATRVAPSVFVMQVLVPILLGPLVTDGALAHGRAGVPLTALGVALVLGAAGVLLGRSDAVTALLEEDVATSRASGSTTSSARTARATKPRTDDVALDPDIASSQTSPGRSRA
jgi:drug/metabolite transporter (DMT)-like permease